MTHSGRARLAANLAILSSIQIGVVFLVQLFIVFRLGAHRSADVFFASQTFPHLVRALGLESLTLIAIPILKRQEDRGKSAYWPLLGGVFLLVFVFCTLFVVFGLQFAKLLFPGFDSAAVAQVTRLSVFQIPGIFGYGALVVMAAYHHVEGGFETVAWAGVGATLVGLIVTVVGFEYFGVDAAAIGQAIIAGGASLVLVRFRHGGRPDHKGRAVVALAMRRISILGAGGLASRTIFVVDRYFASMLPPGTLALLDIANRVAAATVRVVNQALVAPLVPSIAEVIIGSDQDGLRRIMRRRSVLVVVAGAIMLIGGVGAIIAISLVAKGPGSGLISYSNLDAASLTQLGTICLALGGVFLFGSGVHLFNSTYYSKGIVLFPIGCAILAQGIGIFMKVLLQARMGASGLALASSVQYLLLLVLLYMFGRRFLFKANC